jgi:DNA repair ATPase RecN
MSFKSDSRRFLKHPDLQHEAALMIHPHYIRGASMDTQIEDNGMSMEAASRYFGVSEQVIQSKYKDKNAIQDASRDVRLLNAQMEDLEERKKRNRSESSMGGATRASKEEVQELRRQLQESHERENLKITQVAKLEERLDKMHTAQDKHHEEIMKALSKESKGQAPRKRRTKGY